MNKIIKLSVLLITFGFLLNVLVAQSTVRWNVSQPASNSKPASKTTGSGWISYLSSVYNAPHGKVIGKVRKGQAVIIHKLSRDSNWYHVTAGSMTGYVPSHIVVQDKPVSTSNSGGSGISMPEWNVTTEPEVDEPEPEVNEPEVNSEDDRPSQTDDSPVWSPPVENDPLPPEPRLKKMPGYTTASLLNVRTGPWGKKIGQLPYKSRIKIIGQDGEWFKIEHNGGTAYLHSRYVMMGNLPKYQVSGVSAGAGLGKKLVASAKSYIGSKDFRGSEVAYGRLACAQFVSTVLNDNNVMPVVLNVRKLVSKLKMQGWTEVTPPPYKDGDVVTWKTYDYTGDGIKDPDSHVGIVNVKSNGVYAIHNSSSRRYPRETRVNYGAPVCKVLRAP